jgi:3-deoxy-7-phosphoheptulonate synthase
MNYIQANLNQHKQSDWTPSSYRGFPAVHQPEWLDIEKLEKTLQNLRQLPSLVFSGETRMLKNQLTGVNDGKHFLLQIGNCSESFSDCNGPLIHNFLRIMLQMEMVLALNGGKEIIKVGRVAGQYAKPRSQATESLGGREMITYRGDNVNSDLPDENMRRPDPGRLLEGYYRSAATLNLIRAFTQGGYTELPNISDWEHHFFNSEIHNLEYYQRFEEKLTKAISGGNISPERLQHGRQIFISHEALLLNYEEVFTRLDTTMGGYYDTSAHLLWIGDRTRQPGGAHVEFMRGIGNPVGIKVGPDFKPDDIVEVVRTINPSNEKGKIILISRMGKDRVEEKLTLLIRSIQSEGLEVIWSCDPMHGNTFAHNGYKIRAFDDIVQELKGFSSVCRAEGVIPGGVHLEVTGENVTECTGGVTGLSLDDIPANYKTKVDPRLNAAQALELAFVISEMI